MNLIRGAVGNQHLRTQWKALMAMPSAPTSSHQCKSPPCPVLPEIVMPLPSSLTGANYSTLCAGLQTPRPAVSTRPTLIAPRPRNGSKPRSRATTATTGEPMSTTMSRPKMKYRLLLHHHQNHSDPDCQAQIPRANLLHRSPPSIPSIPASPTRLRLHPLHHLA